MNIPCGCQERKEIMFQSGPALGIPEFCIVGAALLALTVAFLYKKKVI